MIDWAALTRNLRRHYGPLARVARAIEADPATLRRLERGEVQEPRFGTGLKLLDLHFDVCPDKHHELRVQ